VEGGEITLWWQKYNSLLRRGERGIIDIARRVLNSLYELHGRSLLPSCFLVVVVQTILAKAIFPIENYKLHQLLHYTS
jgi:hypothetical protein